jgi:hypothetical protein
VILSRRHFLALSGTVGGAAFLVACGDDASQESNTPAARSIVQRFPNNILVPGPIRLPISLATDKGLETTGPDTLTAEFLDADGKVLETISAPQRSIGERTPLYWALRTTAPAPGIYRLAIEGTVEESGFVQVLEPEQVTMPIIGGTLPPFDTPTVADPRGVDPFCSRLDGPCPFHDVTLREALEAGRPFIYVIGTPAHCQTATCAPGLDFLIGAAEKAGGGATIVHADVYADNAATTLSPAVQSLGLSYEPVLYVCDGTGKIIDRLDAIWDEGEADDAVALVS